MTSLLDVLFLFFTLVACAFLGFLIDELFSDS